MLLRVTKIGYEWLDHYLGDELEFASEEFHASAERMATALSYFRCNDPYWDDGPIEYCPEEHTLSPLVIQRLLRYGFLMRSVQEQADELVLHNIAKNRVRRRRPGLDQDETRL